MWYKNIAAIGSLDYSQGTRVTDGQKNGQNYDFQDRASIAAARGKKRLNNKISFVKFILVNWQFKVMTAGSQPHGARWPRFHYYVQTIEAMSLAAAVVTKMITRM